MLWRKNKQETKLKNLVNSEIYKNSKYEIQIVNGKYGLKNKITDNYVDLVSPGHEWEYGSYWTECCFGSINNVLYAFYFKNPIVKPLKIEKVF